MRRNERIGDYPIEAIRHALLIAASKLHSASCEARLTGAPGTWLNETSDVLGLIADRLELVAEDFPDRLWTWWRSAFGKSDGR